MNPKFIALCTLLVFASITNTQVSATTLSCRDGEEGLCYPKKVDPNWCGCVRKGGYGCPPKVNDHSCKKKGLKCSKGPLGCVCSCDAIDSTSCVFGIPRVIAPVRSKMQSARRACEGTRLVDSCSTVGLHGQRGRGLPVSLGGQ
uniref:Putative secreted peptide n=1 Tax=Hyalomma excavatum TaxID=257692 RepID=A0A131XQ29_9ACAR